MVGHFTLHVCPWGHWGSQEGRWPQEAQHSVSSPGYFLPEPLPPSCTDPVGVLLEVTLLQLPEAMERRAVAEPKLCASDATGCILWVAIVVQSLTRVQLFWPHELQQARLLCPPLSPGVCSNSCPLSLWCYLAVSSSAIHFPFCL